MGQRNGHWEGGKRNAWREPKWECYDESSVLPWGTETNDDIRRILGVACITDKVREARLRWYWHVQWRDEGDYVKRILKANVVGQRRRGRQRNRWIDIGKYNMEDLQLNVEDAENRTEWRRRTRVADTLPEGSTAWRRERERKLRVRFQWWHWTAISSNFTWFRRLWWRQRLNEWR